MENLRIFIAVELPQDVKNNLLALQDEMKKTGADVKWVKPEDMHLTLVFLGSTPPEKIPAVGENLKKILSGFRPFDIELEGTGSFPESGKPRVIWAGVSGGSEDLARLQKGVEDVTRELGFAGDDRGFTPHLTLGRVRGPGKLEALQAVLEKRKTAKFGTVRITSVEIIKSEPGPEGPVYKLIENISL